MLSGLNKVYKVGFLSDQSSEWMGGVNYYKNLFIALSKVDGPIIIPYIKPLKDDKIKFLLDYAKEIQFKKTFKYYVTKFFLKILKKDFSKENLLEQCPKMNIISHMQTTSYDNFIGWIPDFQHIHLQGMFSEQEVEIRNESYHELAKESLLVILSSEDALKDFKNFAPEYSHKARVLNFVAIPDKDIYKKTDEMKDQIIKKFDLPDKYFYVPNQFWRHKNHKVAFEAISLLKKQGLDIKVVFTGNANDYRHANYFNELMEYAKANSIQNNIKLLGLVDSMEVSYLIRNCISIINPSLFEGWASTVEEAKSIGKNIILSNIEVHKEQNPPKGIYFDPNNAQELSKILKEKWEKNLSSPDYELEKEAQANLENRIIEFGKAYQNIVLEAIQLIK